MAKAGSTNLPNARSAEGRGDGSIEPVKFAHYLQAKLQGMRERRSGRKTRLKLMVATCQLIDEQLFTDLNVIDICEHADVAKGTFYLQFETKEDVIYSIFEEYIEFEALTIPRLTPEQEPFERTRRLIAWYERTFGVNAGLMRNFVRLSDSDTKVAELWRRRNERIVEPSFVSYLWDTKLKAGDDGYEFARLAMRSMGGIMDYAMFARHGIHEASDFTGGVNEETLIDLHAILIFRALTGQNPPATSLSAAVQNWASSEED
jgi:AcrR family transcriptional regulator